MSLTTREISAIIFAGNYPELSQIGIEKINLWLKKKFGTRFQCQHYEDANILIKTISAWTKHYQCDIQAYIDNEIWQGQRMNAFAFQDQILTKEFKRNPLRKKAHTIKDMLKEMLKLFCPLQPSSSKSTFERNKIRNFIASSKLEGIDLDG